MLCFLVRNANSATPTFNLMKPIFKNHSLQNIFVLIVGYFGLMFGRQAFDFWADEEWFAALLNGGLAYSLFGSLLGLPPFNNLIK